MKPKSLAEFNPYLKGKQPVAAVFARTVESSAAIEGVHIKLAEHELRTSRRKQNRSRIHVKSS